MDDSISPAMPANMDLQQPAPPRRRVWAIVAAGAAAVLALVLLVYALASSAGPRAAEPGTLEESSWGASRAVVGKEVTLSINPRGGEGVFTIEERLSGPTIVDYPPNCGVNQDKTILTCDYDLDVAGEIVYETSGSGTVVGVIAGVNKGEDSSIVKEITGAAEISS